MKVAVVSSSPARQSLYRLLMPGHELIHVSPGEFMNQTVVQAWDIVLMDACLARTDEPTDMQLISRLHSLDGVVTACPRQGACVLRHDGSGGIQFKCSAENEDEGQTDQHRMRTLIFQDSPALKQG